MTNLPSEAQCKRASSLFNDLIEPGLRYAERKRFLTRPLAAYSQAADLWEGFPEGWEESALGMLAAGSVFTRPDRLAGFLRGTKEPLADRLVDIARLWRKRPWAWAFFAVVEDLGDRLLRVEPVGTPPSTWSDAAAWNELLIYSPVVTDNYHRGSTFFFTQIADTGPAFVTYGAIIPFRGLEQADVLFAADVVRHTGDEIGSVPLIGLNDPDLPVSDIAAADPLPFLAMLRNSETPPVRTRQGAPGRYASHTGLPDRADPWNEAAWQAAAARVGEALPAFVLDEAGAALTLGEGSPMYDPFIYFSRDTGHAFLEARTLPAYERGRAVATGIIDFPKTPEVRAGIVVVAAMAGIVGLDDTLLDECGVLRGRYEQQLVGTGESDETYDGATDGAVPSSVEEFQAIADLLIANHNEGLHRDDAEIAEELGIDAAVVEGVRRQMEGMLSRMTEGSADLPAADRFGLPPNAFAQLTKRGEPKVSGVFRLRGHDELRGVWRETAEAPHAFAIRWLLERALSDEGLPATQAGYLATAVVAEAYAKSVIAEDRYRPRKEAEWPLLHQLRRLAESANLLRLSGKAFAPTDAAARLVDDPAGLYHHLLVTVFRTENWMEGARFEPPSYLHEMTGFLLYAAGTLCDARRDGTADGGDQQADWVPVDMLTDRFISALPELAQAVREESEEAGSKRGIGLRGWMRAVVSVHLLYRIGVGFALIETDGGLGSELRFRTTPLYEAVFERA